MSSVAIVLIFFHVVKKNKADFLTTWSLSSGLNVSEFKVYEEIFCLDRNLFHCTGQTFYQTVVFRRYKEVDIAGEMSPYQRKTYFAGIGESVSLYCGAVASYNPITVLWSFNKSTIRFNDSFRNTKTYIKEGSTECEISSNLNINFIEDTDFWIFTRSFETFLLKKCICNTIWQLPHTFHVLETLLLSTT